MRSPSAKRNLSLWTRSLGRSATSIPIALLALLAALIAFAPAADHVVVTGTTDLPGVIDITIDGTVVGSTQAQQTGRWSFSWSSDTVAVGNHVLGASRAGRSLTAIPVRVGPERNQLLLNVDVLEDSRLAPDQVNGFVHVSGWAVDKAASVGIGVESVTIYWDGLPPTSAPAVQASLDRSRPDVAGALRSQQFSSAGWTANVTTGDLRPGAHYLYVVARSAIANDTSAVRWRVVLPLAGRAAATDREPVQPEMFSTPQSVAADLRIAQPTPGQRLYGTSLVRIVGLTSVLVALVMTLSVLINRTREVAIKVQVILVTIIGLTIALAADPTSTRSSSVAALLESSAGWAPRMLIGSLGFAGNVPIASASFLAVPAAIGALGLAAAGPRWNLRPWWLAVVTIDVVVVLLSGQRGPLLGVLVGLSTLVLAAKFDVRVVLGLWAATAVAALGAVILTDTDYLAPSRIQLWARALSLVEAAPIDPGFGTFAQVSNGAFEAHNTPLELLVDFGIGGALAVVTALVLTIRAWSRAIPRDALRNTGLAGIGCILVWGVSDSLVTVAVPLKTTVALVVSPALFVFLALATFRADASSMVDRREISQSQVRSSTTVM